MSPSTTAPAGGESLTVGGRPARLVEQATAQGRPVRYLVVEWGGGRRLTVTATWPMSNPISRQDVIRIAENTVVRAGERQAWIGAR